MADLMDILAREKISLEETAFIGDDLNDLPCMQLVGLKGCPGDAAQAVINVADYVTNQMGGQGAVREFIEWIRDTII